MQTKETKNLHVTGRRPQRRAASNGQTRKKPEAQIVYTPAKPFQRKKFLLRLLTVAAVVLALVFGLSIFFKVRHVEVSGVQKYNEWEIKEASGIADGDALLSLSEAKISARIRTHLPYVNTVRIGIKLPDTVKIEITELETVYAIEDSGTGWWLLNAEGKVVDKTSGAAAKGYTRILGVELADPVIGQQAVAFQPETTEPSETDSSEPVITVALVQPAHQLEAAIAIVSALEDNGLIGRIETVDVSDPEALQMWYEDRFLVELGDIDRMDYKIRAIKSAVGQMNEYRSGQLDASFEIWQDRVGFTPFDSENTGE